MVQRAGIVVRLVLTAVVVAGVVPAQLASASSAEARSTSATTASASSAVARSTSAPARATHSPIEAYVEPGENAIGRTRQAATHAAVIGIDGVVLTEDGAALEEPPAGIHRLAAVARSEGSRSELLVSNFSSALSDFSPDVATRLLSDPERRRDVAEDVAAAAARAGVDGVQIDFESMHHRHRAGLVAFATEVRTAVHERLGDDAQVSMAVMASTRRGGYGDRGYDLAGLAPSVDRFVLMTYDQHGPWSEPGTIGALSWTRKAVAAALAEGIPADRMDLGVATYGYSWPAHGDARQVTPAAARKAAGSRAVWSDTTGEWHARLPDGRVLSWSDDRSLRVRQALARGLGLHGTAVWSLNLASLTHG